MIKKARLSALVGLLAFFIFLFPAFSFAGGCEDLGVCTYIKYSVSNTYVNKTAWYSVAYNAASSSACLFISGRAGTDNKTYRPTRLLTRC